jgi:putative transcriptional regulator
MPRRRLWGNGPDRADEDFRALNYDGTIRLVADDRPIDALLAAFAARTLGAPLTALVAAHLELKPENRGYVAALEAVHGVFLEELKPVPLAGRDRRLVNIFASAAEPVACAPVRPTGDNKAVLPRAVRRLAGCDYGELPWRSRASGLKEVLLPPDVSGTARFVSTLPGRRLPLASEDGLVAGLVLVGAASDRSGYHERGDIMLAGHRGDAGEGPLAEGDGECVCFIVAEKAAKESGPLMRILHLVTRA